MKKYIVSSVVLTVLLSCSICFAETSWDPNYQTDPSCTSSDGGHMMVTSTGFACNWPKYVAPTPASAPVQAPLTGTTIKPAVKTVTPIVKTPAKAPVEVSSPIMTQAEPEVVIAPPVDFQPQIDGVKADLSQFKRNVVGGMLFIIIVDIFSSILIYRRIR